MISGINKYKCSEPYSAVYNLIICSEQNIDILNLWNTIVYEEGWGISWDSILTALSKTRQKTVKEKEDSIFEQINAPKNG